MQKKVSINYILFGITIFLAIAAVVLGQRIYQLRNESISPTAPKSRPKAADSCSQFKTLQLCNPTSLSTDPCAWYSASVPEGPCCAIRGTPNDQACLGAAAIPNSLCTLSFTVAPGPTGTPTPTPPIATFTPAPTTTPAPPSSCGSTCDANYNQCPSDAPYCVDYEGDSKGPICGRQQIAGQGPKCETPGPGCGDLCDVNNNKCPSDAPYCVDFEGDNKAAVCGKQSIAGLGPQCNPAPTATTGQITPVIQLPPAGMTGNTIWAVIGGVAFVFLGLLFL